MVPRLVLVAAVALAGCGGSDAAPPAAAPEPEPAPAPAALTRAERQQLRDHEGRIQAHCVAVAQALVDPSAAPGARETAAAYAAANDLVALAARKPRAELGAGQDLRLFVSDVAENLEGSNCDPRLIARLEQGLRRIPVE